MNTIKTKGVLSLSLVISFIITTFSGIGLFFSPSGRIARETNWLFLGISKFKLENMHTIFGFIMSALAILHLAINYKIFLLEIKPKAVKDLKRIPKNQLIKILEKIEKLQFGLQGDIKRLTDFAPEYRLRIGDYRILFEIEGNKLIIYRILHRKNVYK